jgi:DNA-binding Lrp family transcriptional regulator
LKFDEVDIEILRSLIENSRIKKVDIAKKCGMTSVAVLNRIEVMKKNKLIIKPILYFNMAYFGYPHPVVIGVDLNPEIEEDIITLIKEQTILAGVDKTFGEYNLCIFAFAKSLKDLDRIKKLILSRKGVNKIEVNIWHEFHLNYNNINFLPSKESGLNG